jgi:hypothetical protein
MARRRQPPSQRWKTFCRRHCVDGFVRSRDDLVSAVVWLSDPAAFPPPASVAGCDRTAERPLDCPSTDRKSGCEFPTGTGIECARRPASSPSAHIVSNITMRRHGQHATDAIGASLCSDKCVRAAILGGLHHQNIRVSADSGPRSWGALPTGAAWSPRWRSARKEFCLAPASWQRWSRRFTPTSSRRSWTATATIRNSRKFPTSLQAWFGRAP